MIALIGFGVLIAIFVAAMLVAARLEHQAQVDATKRRHPAGKDLDNGR